MPAPVPDRFPPVDDPLAPVPETTEGATREVVKVEFERGDGTSDNVCVWHEDGHTVLAMPEKYSYGEFSPAARDALVAALATPIPPSPKGEREAPVCVQVPRNEVQADHIVWCDDRWRRAGDLRGFAAWDGPNDDPKLVQVHPVPPAPEDGEGPRWVRRCTQCGAHSTQPRGVSVLCSCGANIGDQETVRVIEPPLAEDGEPVCKSCGDAGGFEQERAGHEHALFVPCKDCAEDGEAAREEAFVPYRAYCEKLAEVVRDYLAVDGAAESFDGTSRRRMRAKLDALIGTETEVQWNERFYRVCEREWVADKAEREAPPAPESAPEAGA